MAPAGGNRGNGFAGDCITAARQGAAGVCSKHSASGSMVRAEMALTKDKFRLSLRSHGSPKARSFKFSDTIGPSRNSTSPLASPRSGTAVPGSPRNNSHRGVSAGKLMSIMRGTVASEYESSRSDYDTGMTWPHRRGSEDSIRSIPQARIGSPVASHRSVSPSRLRRPGSTASSESTAGVSSRHDMSALAATAAAAAENEAEVDVLELGGVGRDGSTRPLSPRVRDSHWLDGLSPRMAERGGSRLFPTHLTTPHSMGGGSVPGSPRLSPRATPVAAVSQGPRSPRQSSKEDSEVRGQGPRSPRQSSKEDPERQKRPPRAKERSKERREGTVETVALTSPSASPEDSPQAAQSGDTRPRLPSWAAPNAGRPDPPARSGNDDRSETGKWQQAAWATPLNPAVEAPTASQDNVEVASSAPSSRAASRLQELRAQLENSLRVAEQGLHADLRLLDQRLSAARRSGKESAESSSVKGK